MTPQEELRQTLSTMLRQIEAGPGANPEGPTVADHVRAIDRLTEELGPELPRELLHLLERHSFAKALDFIEGRVEEEQVNTRC